MLRHQGAAESATAGPERGETCSEDPDEFERLAHDLRSPLAVVLSFAEVLSEADDGERQRLCARVVANTRRALEVLEEFSLLRELRSGAAELEAEADDVAAIVSAAATAVAAQTVSGAERIDFSCAGAFQVPCDRLKLVASLRGLFRQLIRRVAVETPLRLRLTRVRAWVNLDVSLEGLDPDTEIDWETAAMELLRRTAALHGGKVVVGEAADCPGARLSLPALRCEG